MKPFPPTASAFLRFACSQTADFIAYHMLSVAVGWQIYDLTQSAMALGLVGLAQFLPQFVCTLPAGHLADTRDRRVVAMCCQAIQLVMALVLAVGSLSGWLTEGAILLCAMILGGARAFVHPSMQSLLPSLVAPEILPRSLAVCASCRQTGIIIGPALGGALYLAGPGAVYLICAAFFLFAVASLSTIASPRGQTRREPASVRSVLEGITYIRSKPEILGAISLDLFSVLLGGATALLPIFARDILHASSFGLGLLRAAPAVGALGMSLYLARRPLQGRVGRTMFAAVAVFGLGTIVFGLSENFLVSLAALATLGASDMISVVIRSTLIQLETPDEKRGRVSAVNSIFIGTSNQLGEFESGVTASWFGAAPAVVIGGVGTLLVVGLWLRFFPALLHRDRLVPDSGAR